MSLSKGTVIKSQNIKYVDQASRNAPDFTRLPLPSGGNGSTLKAVKNRQELEQLRREWEERLSKAERESFNGGFSEGMQQGRELEKKEALLALRACSDLLRETAALKNNILQTVEQEVLHLAFSIARKVLHQEVTTKRDIIAGVLKSAIRNIVDREDITVRLHPEDFQFMMEIKPEFLSNFDGIRNIVFEQDGSIRRGGAILETRFGEVDARLEQQLEEVETALTAP
jgi:flagellar assembly protein FliH